VLLALALGAGWLVWMLGATRVRLSRSLPPAAITEEGLPREPSHGLSAPDANVQVRTGEHISDERENRKAVNRHPSPRLSPGSSVRHSEPKVLVETERPHAGSGD
jgi:hypothetical protein